MKSKPISVPTVVHGYDDRLRRGVWIELLPAGAPPLSTLRRDLDRPARSRWLTGRRTTSECWDAYEATEGQPLLEAARTPQPWSRVRHWLSDLSGEIAAGSKDGSLPALAIDRIWIGSDDRARLLDWPPPGSVTASSKTADAQRFLYGIAAGALRGVHPDHAENEPLAMPLPLPARALLESLRTGAAGSLDAIHAQAEAQLRSPAAVTARRRATQVAVSALAPVFFPVVLVGAIYLQQRTQTSNPEAYALKACAGQLVGLERRAPNLTDEQRERRRLIEIYIAEHLRDEVEESAIVAQRFPVVNRVKGEHELAARAIANHPTRTPEDVKKAEEVVATIIEGQNSSLAKLATPRALVSLTVIAAAFGSAFVGVLALIGSLAARGGFTFRPFGAALVRKDGKNASRLRAMIRVIVAWSPIPLACYLVVKGPNPAVVSTGRTLLEITIYLVFVAGAVWTILHPSRGIQDRIAGTWIVPR